MSHLYHGKFAPSLTWQCCLEPLIHQNADVLTGTFVSPLCCVLLRIRVPLKIYIHIHIDISSEGYTPRMILYILNICWLFIDVLLSDKKKWPKGIEHRWVTQAHVGVLRIFGLTKVTETLSVALFLVTLCLFPTPCALPINLIPWTQTLNCSVLLSSSSSEVLTHHFFTPFNTLLHF